MSRVALVERLADAIDAVRRPHPVRVAVDGSDAAGKTTLADELGAELLSRGRAVIRASVDGFHLPRAVRYRQGEESPQGYYEDSFDLPALRRALLEPLGPGGDRRYRVAVFDHRADAPVGTVAAVAPDDAVLVLDGVFLQRPELLASWDLRIFVAARFEQAFRRALSRDVPSLGSSEAVERRYRVRYVPGQQRYFAAVRPREIADLVVDNDDVERPRLTCRQTA
jgi:uridine kinase